MMNQRWTCVVSSSVCLVVGCALAAVDQRSYKAISDRNLFGLKAASQPLPQPPPPPSLPRLTLTGITTILGNKRALLKAMPASARAGDAAREQSFILTEGQRDDFVEVLEIDEAAGAVTLRNSGTLMTLTFDKDGPKLPKNVPAPPSPVDVHGATLPGAQANAAIQGGSISYQNAAPASGGRQIPMRAPRVIPNADASQLTTGTARGSSSAPASGSQSGSLQTGGTLPTSPSANQGQPAQVGTPTQVYQQPQLSAEEQAALLEVQRQLNQQNAPSAPAGTPPPLPPLGTGPGTVNPDPRTVFTPDRPPLTPVLPQ